MENFHSRFFFLTSDCCNNLSYYFDVSEYRAWKGVQCCVVYNVSRLCRFISFSDKFRRFTESGSATHKVSIFWIGINREIQRERDQEIERVVLLFNTIFFSPVEVMLTNSRAGPSLNSS